MGLAKLGRMEVSCTVPATNPNADALTRIVPGVVVPRTSTVAMSASARTGFAQRGAQQVQVRMIRVPEFRPDDSQMLLDGLDFIGGKVDLIERRGRERTFGVDELVIPRRTPRA